MSERNPVIVFAIFPGVTQLDFTGPHQVFSALPGAEVMLASSAGGTIDAGVAAAAPAPAGSPVRARTCAPAEACA